MKRFVSVLALCALFLLPQRAMGAVDMLVAVTTTGVGTQPANGYPTATCDVVRVQVWSASGSTSTVLIQVRSNDSTSPWYTVSTITDVSATGEYWSIPISGFVRVNVSARSAGTISATMEGYRGATRIW